MNLKLQLKGLYSVLLGLERPATDVRFFVEEHADYAAAGFEFDSGVLPKSLPLQVQGWSLSSIAGQPAWFTRQPVNDLDAFLRVMRREAGLSIAFVWDEPVANAQGQARDLFKVWRQVRAAEDAALVLHESGRTALAQRVREL